MELRLKPQLKASLQHQSTPTLLLWQRHRRTRSIAARAAAASDGVDGGKGGGGRNGCIDGSGRWGPWVLANLL